MSADFSEMRASDADRDRVIDVLRGAAGDGRLTAEEFEERMAAALASRTLGELAVLTADLVVARPTPSVAVPAQGRDVIRIDQRGGTVQQTGRWMVPRRLELRSSWCDVTLDFTEAVIVDDTLVISMNVRGGSLILVVGPGIVVEADDLMVRYTDVEVRSDADPGMPVILRVRLAGRMRYGYVGTRPPREGPGADALGKGLPELAAGVGRGRSAGRCSGAVASRLPA